MNEYEFKDFIEGNSLIVLDTNVLLCLFKYSSYSSLTILKILKKCSGQVWIPNQVCKEYERNQFSEKEKIKKKYENFQKDLRTEVVNMRQKLFNRINESKKLEYPNCDLLEKKVKKHTDDLISEIDNYKNKLGIEYQLSLGAEKVHEIESFILNLKNNNRMGEAIAYSEMIAIVKEGELRFRYELPPGYEDAKNKKGMDIYGDLFIWKEILKLPLKLNISSILFVTNDLKEDWWILKGSRKRPDKIRSELEEEFKEINNKASIELITLSAFYEKASKYFCIQSFDTELELNAEDYVKAKIWPMFIEELSDELINYAVAQDISDFSDEFYKCNDNEILEGDVEIEFIDFRIEENSAIYSIKLLLPIEIYLAYEDNEGDRFSMGEVYYNLNANVEFIEQIDKSQKKQLEGITFGIKGYEISDLDVIDPYDYYSDDKK